MNHTTQNHTPLPPTERWTTIRRRLQIVPSAGLALFAALMGLIAVSPASAQASSSKPTVVLVHGAFGDASGWAGVTGRLHKNGYSVIALANPLRGLASDSGYIKARLAQIDGPIVLVGHSYGGAVITNAATGNLNVKALVYIAAYAPAAGESIGALGARFPEDGIHPEDLTVRTYPAADGTSAPEATIKPTLFRRLFGADLPKAQTDLMATAQRPLALSSFGEPSAEPAWATIPSWYLVAGADAAIGPKLERFMATRMKAKTVEVKGASHAVFMSRVGTTTDLIIAAAKKSD